MISAPAITDVLAGDDDADRKIQAEVLLNAYSRELDRRRLQAGIHGVITGDGILLFSLLKCVANDSSDSYPGSDDDDSSEEFHYPQTPPPRPSSMASGSTDYSHRVPADLTPQLTQAPDFRVPTHETPQKVLTPRWTPPTPRQLHSQWERDDSVPQCRDCNRRFNFLVRRVRFNPTFIVFCD